VCSSVCVSVPPNMTGPTRMSPVANTTGLSLDTKGLSSPPYATSPYRLSPHTHSSPTPSDHHSTPSPRRESATSPSVHTPMWLGTPREERSPREHSAQDGPLNLSKPRSDFKRERESSGERHSFSSHYNGSERANTPPPAHSNHKPTHNSTAASLSSSLSSPPIPSPPKVSLPETSSPLFHGVRPPFLPPQYSPYLGLTGHLPMLNNNFSYLMNGGKLPSMAAMDADKVKHKKQKRKHQIINIADKNKAFNFISIEFKWIVESKIYRH